MIPHQELEAGQEAVPIFVDETGRRSRLVRLAAYGIGAVCLGYTALVGISIAGNPALPRALMPFPDRVSLLNREGAPAENSVHMGLRPQVPEPLVALAPTPPRSSSRTGDSATLESDELRIIRLRPQPRTSTVAVAVAVRPTPSPTQGTQPVSPPPMTTEPTQPPDPTPTQPASPPPQTSEPTQPPEPTPTPPPPTTQPPELTPTPPPTTQPPTSEPTSTPTASAA